MRQYKRVIRMLDNNIDKHHLPLSSAVTKHPPGTKKHLPKQKIMGHGSKLALNTKSPAELLQPKKAVRRKTK